MEKLKNSTCCWVLVLVWTIVGIIAFHFLSIVTGIIQGAYLYSQTGTMETISTVEFIKSKSNFELLADKASDIYEEEYKNNKELLYIKMSSNSVSYYYEDSKLNKTVFTDPKVSQTSTFEHSDEVENAFKELFPILLKEARGEVSVSVIVSEDQIIFPGYESSVVYQKDSITKPKEYLHRNKEESEFITKRLSLKWFECFPKSK